MNTFLGRRLNPQTMMYGEFTFEAVQRVMDVVELNKDKQGQAFLVLEAIAEEKRRAAK